MRDRLRSYLAPPRRIQLSKWSEENLRLPEGDSAVPGRLRHWPYMVEIIDAMDDPDVEQVTLQKSIRLGFTKGIAIAVSARAKLNPRHIGLLLPTDEDALDYATDEIDPLFEANETLAGVIDNVKRNTLTRKSIRGGGSLKILSARSPRKLRRHDLHDLFVDEADGFELTKEGDPIAIGIGRTFAHVDRKIVIGSTPTNEETSTVAKHYKEGDQCVYEVPCPHCGTFFEIDFYKHIRWPDGEPEKAFCVCEHCGPEKPIHERYKLQMVYAGRWHAKRPGARTPSGRLHRSFKISALVSLLPLAAWGILAAEFLVAKRGGMADLQVFTNQKLAETWKTTLNPVDATMLAERAEEFGLSRIPAEVVLITGGTDTQDDRIETTLLGWTVFGQMIVLGHVVIEGSTLDDATWATFDRFLRTRWQHPNGWSIGIDGCAIDSGGREGRTQKVYDFCEPRAHRNIFAIKGDDGPRQLWKRAAKAKGTTRLYIVGKDAARAEVLERLATPERDDEGRPNAHYTRLSADLPEEWYDQATGLVRRIRYVRTRAVIEYEPRKRGQRVEALDCLCYGFAVRHASSVRAINLAERAARKLTVEVPGSAPVTEGTAPAKIAPRTPGAWAKRFNGGK